MSKSPTTFEDILTCARTLVVSGGYNGFSYADIAEVVGIRKASIHHHFPSKLDLVKTVVQRYRLAAREGLTHLEHAIPGALAQLRAYIGYWEACIGDASAPFCVCAMLASELPLLPEEVAVEIRAHFRFLAEWLTSVLERGAREDGIKLAFPAAVEAEAFMATAHGAMLSSRAYGDPAVFGSVMGAQLERMIASKS